MDILYILKESSVNEELIYSLRSLSNLPHDRIFFAGGFPGGIKNIIHIPTKQTGTKYENSTKNLKVACEDRRLSNNFILMNDDFFILKPIKDPVNDFNLHRGTIQSVFDFYMHKYSRKTIYMLGMEQTAGLIKGLGIKEPLSYELHIPMVMNKQNVLKMLSYSGVEKICVLHKRSLYGNLFLHHSRKVEDFKILTKDEKLNNSRERAVISCSDGGWNNIKEYITNLFPAKSNYEK